MMSKIIWIKEALDMSNVIYQLKESAINAVTKGQYDPNKNYCLDCGACCTYFKIDFPSEELKSNGGQVPDEYTVESGKGTHVMKGREIFNKGEWCKSLTGEIGKNVFCTIYEQRPSVCRKFDVITPDGHQNPRCKQARKARGLTPELIP